MTRDEAFAEWTAIATEHRCLGDVYRAQIADYFAAAAAGDPTPSRFAPASLRLGLAELDRPVLTNT